MSFIKIDKSTGIADFSNSGIKLEYFNAYIQDQIGHWVWS